MKAPNAFQDHGLANPSTFGTQNLLVVLFFIIIDLGKIGLLGNDLALVCFGGSSRSAGRCSLLGVFICILASVDLLVPGGVFLVEFSLLFVIDFFGLGGLLLL